MRIFESLPSFLRALPVPLIAVSFALPSATFTGHIQDNEESYSLLARECAASAIRAGRTDASPADYMNYATDLAEIISFLTPAQQNRVFGSVSTSPARTRQAAPSAEAGADSGVTLQNDSLIDSSENFGGLHDSPDNSAGLGNETSGDSGSNFWDQLKKFIDGVVAYFSEDAGSNYEEYKG